MGYTMVIVDLLIIALILIGIVLLIPVVLLFVEILASFAKESIQELSPHERPRITVIVPAHDEELTIRATVASILPELADGDRIIVVADNCTDDTATIANVAGAEVISRTDKSRRGKGYALDFGLRHLVRDPPHVVIIIDADCKPKPGCLAQIAGLAAATQRPVQARNEVAPPHGAGSSYLSMASLAIRVKNFARPLGCLRLGLACQLMGTGMALPWLVTGKANLATPEIVEDLVYGLELARAGYPPLFCPTAAVISEFPVALEAQATQRARWETGHLKAIVGHLPSLLVEAVREADYVLLGMVVDAAVPPLALMAILVGTYISFSLTLAIVGDATVLLGLASAIGLLFSGAVLLAWWRVGRDIVSFYELCRAPFYVLSKLGLYGRVLIGRKVEWIRSKRDTR